MKMNAAIFFLALVAFHSACAYVVHTNESLDDIWIEFKKAHNKSYASIDVEITRRLIWERNLQRINEHNHLTAIGHHSYWLGINEYSDMLDDEFRAVMNGLRQRKLNSSLVFTDEDVSDLPKEIDWRSKGYVTEVKNQKRCGSCWAFAATGSLEGQYFKKTGKLVSLSEQNLIDCTGSCGNNGCGGGLVESAYQCIHREGGIDSEANYPYEAKDDTCRYNSKKAITSLSNYVDIAHFSEDALQKAVATIGPVSVAIDASDFTFAQYKSGVYESTDCTDLILNHGVLVVGYGTENGKDYWLVKNSWGPSWGMGGYIKMARNEGNMCGIATLASYPIL